MQGRSAFLGVVTLAEVRFGIDRMPMGIRRDRLNELLTEELPGRFEDRIMIVNAEVADVWGKVLARGYAIGRPVAAMDALIAATAMQYEIALVTRNVSDFKSLDIPIVNPWSS